MEFSNVIKERYSVRKYKPDMIWDDELNPYSRGGYARADRLQLSAAENICIEERRGDREDPIPVALCV